MEPDAIGRWFACDNPDGPSPFEARLIHRSCVMEIGWTDNIPWTLLRVREVERLAGVRITRIVGKASADLLEWIRQNRFDAGIAADRLGRALGGEWRVDVIPQPRTDDGYEISAVRLED